MSYFASDGMGFELEARREAQTMMTSILCAISPSIDSFIHAVAEKLSEMTRAMQNATRHVLDNWLKHGRQLVAGASGIGTREPPGPVSDRDDIR
jgi:hypothetical protein